MAANDGVKQDDVLDLAIQLTVAKENEQRHRSDDGCFVPRPRCQSEYDQHRQAGGAGDEQWSQGDSRVDLAEVMPKQG